MNILGRYIAGFLLLLLGVVFSIIPLPIGWMFMVAAALFLARDIPAIHKLIVWIERRDPSRNKMIYTWRKKLIRQFPFLRRVKKSPYSAH